MVSIFNKLKSKLPRGRGSHVKDDEVHVQHGFGHSSSSGSASSRTSTKEKPLTIQEEQPPGKEDNPSQAPKKGRSFKAEQTVQPRTGNPTETARRSHQASSSQPYQSARGSQQSVGADARMSNSDGVNAFLDGQAGISTKDIGLQLVDYNQAYGNTMQYDPWAYGGSQTPGYGIQGLGQADPCEVQRQVVEQQVVEPQADTSWVSSWLLECCDACPLPALWRTYDKYFLDESTNQLHHEHPYRKKFEVLYHHSENGLESVLHYRDELAAEVELLEQIWIGPYYVTDASGAEKEYFNNTEMDTSSWDNPYVGIAYIIEVCNQLLETRFAVHVDGSNMVVDIAGNPIHYGQTMSASPAKIDNFWYNYYRTFDDDQDSLGLDSDSDGLGLSSSDSDDFFGLNDDESDEALLEDQVVERSDMSTSVRRAKKHGNKGDVDYQIRKQKKKQKKQQLKNKSLPGMPDLNHIEAMSDVSGGRSPQGLSGLAGIFFPNREYAAVAETGQQGHYDYGGPGHDAETGGKNAPTAGKPPAGKGAGKTPPVAGKGPAAIAGKDGGNGPPTVPEKGGKDAPVPGKGPSAPSKGPSVPGKGGDALSNGPSVPGKGPSVPGKGPSIPGKGPSVPGKGGAPVVPGGKGAAAGGKKGKGKNKTAIPKGKPKFGRRWHWKPIAIEDAAGSIWEILKKEKRISSKHLLKTDKLSELFEIAKPAPPKARDENSAPPAIAEKRGVLEAGRLHIVSIGLSRFDETEVKDALGILTGDPQSNEGIQRFTEDHVERLEGILPNEAEQQMLLEAGGLKKVAEDAPKKQLLPVETKLLPFCEIPKLEQRVRVLGFVKKRIWETVSLKIECLGKISHSIRQSENVRNLFAILLALGNYINLSVEIELTEKAWMEEKATNAVWGISIDSLQKLGDFRGNADRNLLHGIVACDDTVLKKIREDVKDLAEVWIKKLGKPILADILQEMSTLQREIEFVRTFTAVPAGTAANLNDAANGLNIYHSPLFDHARKQIAKLEETVIKSQHRHLKGIAEMCHYLGCTISVNAAGPGNYIPIVNVDKKSDVKDMATILCDSKLIMAHQKAVMEVSEQVMQVFTAFHEIAFTFLGKLEEEEKIAEQRNKRASNAEAMKKLRRDGSMTARRRGGDSSVAREASVDMSGSGRESARESGRETMTHERKSTTGAKDPSNALEALRNELRHKASANILSPMGKDRRLSPSARKPGDPATEGKSVSDQKSGFSLGTFFGFGNNVEGSAEKVIYRSADNKSISPKRKKTSGEKPGRSSETGTKWTSSKPTISLSLKRDEAARKEEVSDNVEERRSSSSFRFNPSNRVTDRRMGSRAKKAAEKNLEKTSASSKEAVSSSKASSKGSSALSVSDEKNKIDDSVRPATSAEQKPRDIML